MIEQCIKQVGITDGYANYVLCDGKYEAGVCSVAHADGEHFVQEDFEPPVKPTLTIPVLTVKQPEPEAAEETHEDHEAQ